MNTLVASKQSWRKVVENIYCPSPQPEDHVRHEDLGFHEDPDIFVEFEDIVYYQASPDGSKVAIMADYPDLHSFVKVSVQKSFKKGKHFRLQFALRTRPCCTGSALSEPYPGTGS